MSTYQTDEEKVEEIKKWWKENGKSVIGGLILGFGIIGGWQGWQGYNQAQGEQASIVFDTMRQSIRSGQTDQAIADGMQLIGEFSSSAYASLAALELARLAYTRDEAASAQQHLQWVVDSAPDPVLSELARVRLGRLLLEIGDLPTLEQLLAAEPLPSFAGPMAELRGDLARVRNNPEGARAAYAQALEAGVDDAELLRMKLVDVGGDA